MNTSLHVVEYSRLRGASSPRAAWDFRVAPPDHLPLPVVWGGDGWCIVTCRGPAPSDAELAARWNLPLERVSDTRRQVAALAEKEYLAREVSEKFSSSESFAPA